MANDLNATTARLLDAGVLHSGGKNATFFIKNDASNFKKHVCSCEVPIYRKTVPIHDYLAQRLADSLYPIFL